MTTLVPMYLLGRHEGGAQLHAPASLHAAMSKSADLMKKKKEAESANQQQEKQQQQLRSPADDLRKIAAPKVDLVEAANTDPSEQQPPQQHKVIPIVPARNSDGDNDEEKSPVVRGNANAKSRSTGGSKVKPPIETDAKNQTPMKEGASDAEANANANAKTTAVAHPGNVKKQYLQRGVSGLPMSKTPALVGAEPGHIECDIDIDDIVYWNNPQGTRDNEFESPFKSPPGSYITFEADPGGWNNIRMSMETIFVLAAATGRTLVLPPKAPFYLLGTGVQNVKSFGNFFPIEDPAFQKRVKVITMSEFIELEGKKLLGLDDETIEKIKPVAEMCLHQASSEINCDILYKYLQDKGLQPPMEGSKDCFIFDQDYLEYGREPDEDASAAVKRFCGNRKVHYLDKELQEAKLIHWDACHREHRLLQHFYTFLFFTDTTIDNYYKRFVRDFLHYKDQIYCAAGKIIHALNEDEPEWSALHIRRGDFQYKMVKLPAEEWYNNTKELWHEGETLFIATDERNKTFFDPIKEHHKLRFLDDYWSMAGLGTLDKNYLGMIDTIVASHGRAFSGTWFSTFTGYINRMRGYLGHSMTNSWYGWLPRKDVMQAWIYPNGNYYAREWPVAWVGIDGDEKIENELDPVIKPTTDAIVMGNNENSNNNNDSLVAPVLDTRNFHNKYTVADLTPDKGFASKPTNRGLAGRPADETPALNSAMRAHIDCEINVDSLAYWNDPQGERDQHFAPPFKESGDEKYITFTVDRGGWNNVRMSMEIIFVIAAATGRTLVLPPKEPLYRLHADLEHIHRGFADFFPLHTAEFQKRVKVISMEEFVKQEGGPDGIAPIPDAMRENVMHSVKHCDKRKASYSSCMNLADYLNTVGHVPDARAKDYCFIFDEDVAKGSAITPENEAKVSDFCGARKRSFWGPELQKHPLIHFRAGDKEWRLLAHYYGFIHFTNPMIGNFYKRFVRDFLHYNDQIYCAAGKIVKALQAEGAKRGFLTDDEGAGGYSAMHIRRGDFQYKKMKFPADQWYNNTKELWKPNEILFIATDERNKTFFNAIAEHHDIRFLDDYFKLAGLGDLDPNYFGMIDTIISSRARAFAGTWLSTFTGYINRMRGHHGMTMMDSWYGFLPKKTKTHEWPDINHFAFSFEWPDGWIAIDTDEVPSKDVF
eukprot:CAMPEP_0119555404 /NCGR_PEP_ID=MMETSP1352-20130426/7633_1 /TAXON_ID=265584 /ORGANISM="Stauroneis constricta, Strain CCMP1120" /LENGTH=1158 /DNA_ID=CAMNT_0007602161 /DNA_START=358 /DNA_END=3834 /DNA_ORIENTATION=+